jgi:hypothetical protein
MTSEPVKTEMTAQDSARDPLATAWEALARERAAINNLRDMAPEDDWGDKFYAALEALEMVVTGRVVAQATPPHAVMARLIEDVARRLIVSALRDTSATTPRETGLANLIHALYPLDADGLHRVDWTVLPPNMTGWPTGGLYD